MKYSITLLLSFLCLIQTFGQSETNLFDYNKNSDDTFEVIQKRALDSVTIFEKVVLEGFDSKIPFYHITNKRNKKGQYVILLHGLGDSKEAWVNPSEPYLEWSRNTTSIKDSLVTLGYSVIIPDVKYHGERSYELGFRAPESLPPVISKNEKDSKTFETLITSTVKDLRIILDYVQYREQRSDQSFNIIGYSLGGNLAILLSVFDNRINSIVGCVPPVNLPTRGLEMFDSWSEDIIQGQLDITPMKYAEMQNRPTLLLMGKTDYFTTEKEANDFIAKIPTQDKKLKFFDAGHILPNDYKIDAIQWITGHSN